MGGIRSRLRLLIAAAVIPLAVGVVFCSRPQAVRTVADYGGGYVEAVAGQPKHVNPILAAPDTIDADLASLVFSGLTRIDDLGNVLPDIASGWTVSGDNKTYTFTLRGGVKWHDGADFTAQDVVFTIQAIRDSGFKGVPEVAQLWRDVNVDAPDPRTVVFQLRDAYAPILEFASIGILPAHLLRAVPASDLPGHSFNAQPVGTGPFRVKGVARDELLLEANSAYYGIRPYLGTLRFRFYPDNARAVTAWRKQETEGLRRLLPEDVAGTEQSQNGAIYSVPDLSKLSLLIFNTRSSLVGDKLLRQAIAHGVDRRRLVDTVLGGQGLVATGPIFAKSWAFHPQDAYDYQPDRFRALLELAGWTYGTEGWHRDGAKLSLVLLTNDNPVRLLAAQEIARQLGALGVVVDVHTAGWSGLVQDFLVPRKFQIALTEQWSPNFDPDTYPFWHSSQIARGLNFASWSNRRADELLENARRSADSTVRYKLYGEFQQIFAEELPALPLYYPSYVFAADRSVKGVRLGTLVTSANRFGHLDEWYVKTRSVPAG